MDNTLDKSSVMIAGDKETVWNAIIEESTGTRVTINSRGFDESLANLKALVEGKEIPYV
jgi:hypothetical protein